MPTEANDALCPVERLEKELSVKDNPTTTLQQSVLPVSPAEKTQKDSLLVTKTTDPIEEEPEAVETTPTVGSVENLMQGEGQVIEGCISSIGNQALEVGISPNETSTPASPASPSSVLPNDREQDFMEPSDDAVEFLHDDAENTTKELGHIETISTACGEESTKDGNADLIEPAAMDSFVDERDNEDLSPSIVADPQTVKVDADTMKPDVDEAALNTNVPNENRDFIATSVEDSPEADLGEIKQHETIPHEESGTPDKHHADRAPSLNEESKTQHEPLLLKIPCPANQETREDTLLEEGDEEEEQNNCGNADENGGKHGGGKDDAGNLDPEPIDPANADTPGEILESQDPNVGEKERKTGEEKSMVCRDDGGKTDEDGQSQTMLMPKAEITKDSDAIGEVSSVETGNLEAADPIDPANGDTSDEILESKDQHGEQERKVGEEKSMVCRDDGGKTDEDGQSQTMVMPKAEITKDSDAIGEVSSVETGNLEAADPIDPANGDTSDEILESKDQHGEQERKTGEETSMICRDAGGEMNEDRQSETMVITEAEMRKDTDATGEANSIETGNLEGGDPINPANGDTSDEILESKDQHGEQERKAGEENGMVCRDAGGKMDEDGQSETMVITEAEMRKDTDATGEASSIETENLEGADPINPANGDTSDEILESKDQHGEQEGKTGEEKSRICRDGGGKMDEDGQSETMVIPKAEMNKDSDAFGEASSIVDAEFGDNVEEAQREKDDHEHVVDTVVEEDGLNERASSISQLEPVAEHGRNDPPSNIVAVTSSHAPWKTSAPNKNRAADSKPDPPELEQRTTLDISPAEHSQQRAEKTTEPCVGQCKAIVNVQEHDCSDLNQSKCTESGDPTDNVESTKDKEDSSNTLEALSKEKVCNQNDVDGDDDEYSYEEIVLDDDEEVVEYVDEILDEYEEDSSFTEVTYESKDFQDDALQQSRGSLTVESSTKRAVIKSSAQKLLEQEEARKLKEAEETRRNMEFRLARQHSFAKKDEDLKRRLAEEEARHIREEEEREKQRIAEQERMAERRAQEAAARIAQQQTADLRRRLEEEEARRKIAEAEAHRLAAEAAAKEKAEAERIRREAEEAERLAREEKRRQMEEEVRILQERLATTKRAAEEAKAKQLEEKKRMEKMVEARRKEKKYKKKKKAEPAVPCEISSSNQAPPVELEKSIDLNLSASSVRTPSPVTTSVASKPKHKVSPLRPVGSPTKTTLGSRSPVGTPKSPVPVSPRRFEPASPTKCVSPLKMHLPKAASPVPASKAASKAASVQAPFPKSLDERNEQEGCASETDIVYYTADQLRKQSVPGLDYKNREQYLHPNEFQEIFEMTREEFSTLPKWKQTNMKRKKKLF